MLKVIECLKFIVLCLVNVFKLVSFSVLFIILKLIKLDLVDCFLKFMIVK